MSLKRSFRTHPVSNEVSRRSAAPRPLKFTFCGGRRVQRNTNKDSEREALAELKNHQNCVDGLMASFAFGFGRGPSIPCDMSMYWKALRGPGPKTWPPIPTFNNEASRSARAGKQVKAGTKAYPAPQGIQIRPITLRSKPVQDPSEEAEKVRNNGLLAKLAALFAPKK